MYDFRSPKKKYVFPNKSAPYKKVCIGMGGQYGDVIMQEPGLREFIKNNPDTKIILAICDKYKEVLPLFYDYHENIIDYKIWEGYDDWPAESDIKYINSQNFDAMFPCEKPEHEQLDWPKYRHITTETALMLGLSASTTNIQLNMPPGVVKEPKTVALHLFSSKWPSGARSLNVEKQTAIVDHVTSKGYKVYQISAPHQPHIKNTTFVKGTYFESCKKMLSTELLISCDSGMLFVASAYDHPTIGLMSIAYHPIANTLGTTKNWQPVNPNAVYLEHMLAAQLPIDKIIAEIDKKI